MSVQEVCEMGTTDFQWLKSTPTMGQCTANLTNTTTTLRPLPDPTHCVQQLRALLSSRPDIGFLRTDTDFLLRFLRVRNFQVASAFQLLCGYYSYRQRERDLFKSTIGGAGVHSAIADGVVGVLQERDASGSAILVILASNCDATKCSLMDLWGAVILSLEALSARGEEAGVVCVVDWSDCPTKLNADLSPKSLRLFLDGLQDAFPLRMSALHLFNAPWWSGPALRLTRPFFKEKARSRIHVHGNNLSSLHKQLPPRLLPAQLGGERGEYSAELWSETVSKNMILKPKNEKVDGEEDSKIIKSTMENIMRKEKEQNEAELKKRNSQDVVKVDENDNKNKTAEKIDVDSSDDEYFNGESDGEEGELTKTSLKDLKLEQLIRPGMRQFHLTETSDNSKDKIPKSLSNDEDNNVNSSPKLIENLTKHRIFNFSKSKSLSYVLSTSTKNGTLEEKESMHTSSMDEVKEEDNSESVRQKSPTSTSFATSFTNSLALNMSKIGVNIRTKDGGGNYECANTLLSNDIH